MGSRRTPPIDNATILAWDCPHCGTIERALTLWPAGEVAGCVCACHVRRAEHDREVLRLRRKRGEIE